VEITSKRGKLWNFPKNLNLKFLKLTMMKLLMHGLSWTKLTLQNTSKSPCLKILLLMMGYFITARIKTISVLCYVTKTQVSRWWRSAVIRQNIHVYRHPIPCNKNIIHERGRLLSPLLAIGATSVALPYGHGLTGTGATVFHVLPNFVEMGEHRGFGFGQWGTPLRVLAIWSIL